MAGIHCTVYCYTLHHVPPFVIFFRPWIFRFRFAYFDVFSKVQVKSKLTFPIPGKLAGISSSSKGVMTMKDVNFAYDMNKGLNLKDVNVKLALNSRVAIVGRNGAGKSTLMGLLCRELNPTEIDGQTGEVWRHHNLRLAFIAQHHMETLGKFYKCTPFQYMQHRFQNGWDEELQKHLIEPKDDEEAILRKELGKKHGKYGLQIGHVIGRTQKGKQLLYEVQWDGITDSRQNTWETLDKFREMGVEKFAIACDERIQAMAAGNDMRQLSRREVVKHLEQYGIRVGAVRMMIYEILFRPYFPTLLANRPINLEETRLPPSYPLVHMLISKVGGRGISSFVCPEVRHR